METFGILPSQTNGCTVTFLLDGKRLCDLLDFKQTNRLSIHAQDPTTTHPIKSWCCWETFGILPSQTNGCTVTFLLDGKRLCDLLV